MFQTKAEDKIKTHNLCSITSSSPQQQKNHAFHTIMWKNDA